MQLLELGLHVQVVSVFNTLWTWRFLFSKQGLAATVFVAAHKTISHREDLLPCAEKDGEDQQKGLLKPREQTQKFVKWWLGEVSRGRTVSPGKAGTWSRAPLC